MTYNFQDENNQSWPGIINNNGNPSYAFAGGTIINNNSNNNYIVSRNDDHSDILTVENVLKQHHVPGATFEAQPRDSGCMPGTRVKILDDVFALLKSYTGPHMVWIAGMAGTGKTSIALTLCRYLWADISVYLGGTFFCSRSAGSIERTDVKRVIPTLATLLARQFAAFASYLAKQLKETPDVAHWSVKDQAERLIAQPLESLGTYTGQLIFVIDALDECSDPSELADLINAIADFRSAFPVKFLLTSRPEMHIRSTPISDPVHSSILRLHAVDPSQVTADIRLYISQKLAHVSGAMTWYSAHDVEALVALSNGLFIFASTVLQYILNRDNKDGRRDRLQKATSAVTRSTAASTTLDQVYELVLTEASRSDRVDADELESMRHILACVMTARASLSVQALADLIGASPDGLRCSLERLHSLVYLPSDDAEPGVRTLHASFSDYMLGRAADHIRLVPSLGHDLLAAGCLRRMARSDLCFNISRSCSSYKANAEFQPKSIPLSLIYACLHWAHHIDAAPTRWAFDEDLGGTLRRKFLFWLEVLSVSRKLNVASGLLRIASSAVNSEEMARFLRDANSFVASSYPAIAYSAPHIYLSAVPFAPKHSLIYQDFASFCSGVVSVENFGTDDHSNRLVMTLTGHEDCVKSVAWSPSGHLLASGSGNGTVRIWDTLTGEEAISPMRNGDGAVYSVAFAPDGQHVASGSDCGAVSVWNIATGRLESRQPLVHSKPVCFVAFSPDGKLIASRSWDDTVGLWNVETGQIVSVQSDARYGSTALVSLSFSSDGTILKLRGCDGDKLWRISAHGTALQLLPESEHVAHSHSFSPNSSTFSLSWDDNSILISEAQTGRAGTLKIPMDNLVAVRMSPDETYLVASVYNNVRLRLWDLQHIEEGDPPVIILAGHTDTAEAISFSFDGRYLASGSRDCTIRIWDACPSHGMVQSVQENEVNAIAVSPDGTFVVCGRSDGSIDVYDAKTGKTKILPLIGHQGFLCSVAISPDGRLIASGSVDKTARLWHAQTGEPVWEPVTGHQHSVLVVTFSSNSRWLASGSVDKTVLIWDVATGKTLDLQPMLCHNMVRAIAFSSDGHILTAGDCKGKVYFWNIRTGQLLDRFELDTLTDSMAFSSSGRWLVSGWEHGDVCIWDLNTKELVHSLDKFGEYCPSVTWSPCERYIAFAAHSQVVWLFDRACNIVTELHGHKSQASSVVFSSNGRFVMSGAEDGAIRVWDIEEARASSERAERDPVARLASAELNDGWLIGPSGELLLWVPADYDGYLQIPPYTTVLGPRRAVVTVNESLHWGDDWHACWRTAAPTTV